MNKSASIATQIHKIGTCNHGDYSRNEKYNGKYLPSGKKTKSVLKKLLVCLFALGQTVCILEK